MKNKLFYVALIISAFLLSCILIATGAYFHSGLDMEVGMPASVMVRAPEDVENRIATDENRRFALRLAEGLEQTYTADPSQLPITLNNLEHLHRLLESIRDEYVAEHQALEAAIIEWGQIVLAIESQSVADIANWDTLHAAAVYAGEDTASLPPRPEPPEFPPEPVWEGTVFNRFQDLPAVSFSESAQQRIVQMPEVEFLLFWNAVTDVAGRIQMETIQEVNPLIMQAVTLAVDNVQGLDRPMADMVEMIVNQHLRPNAIPDETENQRRFDLEADNYERVGFLENQIIVDIGQIVTPDLYDVMSRLGLLRPDSIWDNLIPMIGAFIAIAMLFLTSIMFFWFYRPEMLANKREAMLLFTLYVLTMALIWMLSDFSFTFFPLIIFAMLVAMLIDRRTAMVLTLAVVLICYFIVPGNVEYLLFYSASGLMICLLSNYTTERNKVFLVGILMAAVQFVLSVAIQLISLRGHSIDEFSSLATTAGLAAIMGMLAVIICTGSLPFWETFFGVVTPVKLLDLTNPTNILLRRLTIEAPGTYHHSLIVANLAESAAYDIGANAHAARVGGYYHDIGKLKFPQYFAENIDGENPHNHLDPLNSVQLIISHVSYGLALASEHRLPQFVRDMIKEHHGTTLLQFFYAKAKEGDAAVDDRDYRYPYVIPQTRESACVMLADSIEAAVRAMMPKMKSVDEVQGAIRNIIRGKLNDGQLADSQLSIKDVDIIERSFYRVLKGMYHERIAYPKAPADLVASKDLGTADDTESSELEA